MSEFLKIDYVKLHDDMMGLGEVIGTNGLCQLLDKGREFQFFRPLEDVSVDKLLLFFKDYPIRDSLYKECEKDIYRYPLNICEQVDAYWGSDKRATSDYGPTRQNIVLFCAAMAGQL